MWCPDLSQCQCAVSEHTHTSRLSHLTHAPAVPAATSVTFDPSREGPLYVGTAVGLVCSLALEAPLIPAVDTAVLASLASPALLRTLLQESSTWVAV